MHQRTSTHGTFDAVVIGGGINGAAVAHACARNGISVLLLEKGDLASGTSSRSSRLIHGGVRYLEYAQLGMVFESSRERRILSRLAPHLVRPLAFTWPLYEGGRIPGWKLRGGLTLYDVLSLGRNFGRHRSMGREEVLKREPGLATDGLLGGAIYYDAATDDSRLTISNARSASQHGAVIQTYCAVDRISSVGELLEVGYTDLQSGHAQHCRARVVVNAAGPWAGDITAMIPGETSSPVMGAKGIHIAVPRSRLANIGAVTITSPVDGRVMFVLPARSTSIVGTTETTTGESPDQVRAAIADVQYLIDSVNRYFASAALAPGDVLSAWAGIRPLSAAHFKGEAASTSREHQLRWSGSGVLTISGGKLTTYRVVARDSLELISERLGRGSTRNSATETLAGGNITSLRAEVDEATAASGDADIGAVLAESYGSEWREVWRLASGDAALRQRIHPELPYLRAAIVFAVRHEFAVTIADVLIRRTHVAFETADHGRSCAGAVARTMAAELGWSDSRTADAIRNYDSEVTRIFAVER